MVDDSQVDWDEIIKGKHESKFVDRALKPANKIDVEDLPIFDGNDYSLWPTFRAALDSCIILKKSLDWPQKLHYLLRGLRGYPKDLINDYPRTRMGFARALQTLKDEYDSFQKHKYILIESLKNLKPMDKRDLESIRAPNLLLRRIIMWAAKSGVPTPECWGESLLPLIPMDYATKENWRNFLERKNVDSPSLDHFDQWSRRLMNRLHENVMRKNLESSTPPPPARPPPRRPFQARTAKPATMATAFDDVDDHDELFSEDEGEDHVPVMASAQGEYFCIFCEITGHNLPYCRKFARLPQEEKMDLVRKERLCTACLLDGHRQAECTSPRPCRRCDKQDHHTSLHDDRKSPSATNDQILSALRDMQKILANAFPPKENKNANQPCMANGHSDSSACFRVVPLEASSSPQFEDVQLVNALLDEASQGSFITESLANRLSMDLSNRVVQHVQLLGQQVKRHSSILSPIYVRPVASDKSFEVTLATTASLPSTIVLPDYEAMQRQYPSIRVCQFPTLERGHPKGVDILVGLDYYELMTTEEELPFTKGSPCARRTPLGWTLTHPGFKMLRTDLPTCTIAFAGSEDIHFQVTQSLDRQLHKLYQLESESFRKPGGRYLTKLEKQAIDTVLHSMVMTKKHRYKMRVPWKTNLHLVPDNRKQVKLQQARHVDQLRKKNPEIIPCVAEQFSDYALRGWIEQVLDDMLLGKCKVFCLPWFVVTVLGKSTPHRIVFDCARKFFGFCLNDFVLPGPKTHNEIFDIILRFRMNKVAVTADVSKMYMNFEMYGEDRLLHQFYDHEGKLWQFTSFPFGNAASPFACIYGMTLHLKMMASPEAQRWVVNNFYVDDLLTSFPTTKKAIEVMTEVVKVLREASLPLMKFVSNSDEFLHSIPEEARAKDFTLTSDDILVATLGLKWQPKQDVFQFQSSNKKDKEVTKRVLSSVVSSIYDPFGGLLPFTVRGSKILQEVHRRSRYVDISWDTILASLQDEKLDELSKQWAIFVDDLQHLDMICFPRRLLEDNPITMELHAFSDASSWASAFCMYLVSTYEDRTPVSRFVCAGKKLAPLDGRTIPQLELQGLLMATRCVVRLMEQVLPKLETTFWVDSKTVLQWISDPHEHHKAFVMNRLVEIRDNTRFLAVGWQHVPTLDNPADLPTKGTTVEDLANNNLWHHGPSFLVEDRSTWPKIPFEFKPGNLYAFEEETTLVVGQDEPAKFRTVIPNSTLTTWSCQKYGQASNQREEAVTLISWGRQFDKIFDLKRYSTWHFAIRAVYSLWVVVSGIIPDLESDRRWLKSIAEVMVIKFGQYESFEDDLLQFVRIGRFTARSLLTLRTVFDESGILRSQGRWANDTTKPPEWRSPIMLHARSRVAFLLVNSAHMELGHGCTVQQVKLAIMKKYYVLRLQDLVKAVLHSCIGCQRKRKKTMAQLMAPPVHLDLGLDLLRPFNKVSLDFAVPFDVIFKRSTEKRYALISVCQQTKNIFVEDCFSLAADDFIMALDIMVSTYGTPALLRTDNAGAFLVGKDLLHLSMAEESTLNKLKALELDETGAIKSYMDRTSIQDWSLAIPKTAHTNGLAERFVGLFKNALYQAAQGEKFTRMSFRRLLKRAQNVVNSRPIATYHDGNIDNAVVITPNHFLRPNQFSDLPLRIEDASKEKLVKHFLHTDMVLEKFWRAYQTTLLEQSHKFSKWFKPQIKPLDVNQLVLVADPEQDRLAWRLGKIINCQPDQDGYVRRVELRTFKTCQTNAQGGLKNIKFTDMTRHINGLVPLSLLASESCTFEADVIERLREANIEVASENSPTEDPSASQQRSTNQAAATPAHSAKTGEDF